MSRHDGKSENVTLSDMGFALVVTRAETSEAPDAEARAPSPADGGPKGPATREGRETHGMPCRQQAAGDREGQRCGIVTPEA